MHKWQVLLRMWRTGDSRALLVGMQTGAATVENSMEFPLKIKKIKLPFDPMIPFLGKYTKKPETLIWKNLCTPVFTVALFTITKIWKQPKCPSIDEWVKQLWDIHTTGYYSVIKQKEILPFATAWMDLENIMLSEISQSVKDKCHAISLICEI